MHVSSTLCLHCPDLHITKESLLVHSNPSMSDIRSMVHECSSFLDMHDVKWDENNLPTPETYLCGSMEHSNNICPGLSTWCLMIMMSPFSWVLKAIRRLDQSRPQSSSEAAACQVSRLLDERRKSADGTISTEKQQHSLRRQFSLRRHRWYHHSEGGDSLVEKWRIYIHRHQESLLNFYYYMLWKNTLQHFILSVKSQI